ncbi:MAG TPA: HU family DNA-binding protein [Polyangia bacterium]|jgi:integration host factor subunit beta|nr:HU family DNA-binding protein [Polyangia bacterium]
MTKSDLIDVLCETQKVPKGRAELLVHVIFDSMEASLKRGERIEIRGFGSFEIRNYRPYEGRNPRTGVTVSVRPKRLPFFKVGKELKERVNAGAEAAVAKSAERAGAKRAPAPAPSGDGTPKAAPVTKTGPVSEADSDASESAPNGASRATA